MLWTLIPLLILLSVMMVQDNYYIYTSSLQLKGTLELNSNHFLWSYSQYFSLGPSNLSNSLFNFPFNRIATTSTASFQWTNNLVLTLPLWIQNDSLLHSKASNMWIPNEYILDTLYLTKHTATLLLYGIQRRKETWSLFPKSSLSNTGDKSCTK